jgi:chromosome segregation ATPase
MLYLTIGFCVLVTYCVALTVVVRREIKHIRSDVHECWFALSRHEDNICDLESKVDKADEMYNDIWNRLDAIVDRLLDQRVENILRERDALETKYRQLLQKHNDLAKAYDESKKKYDDLKNFTNIHYGEAVRTVPLKYEKRRQHDTDRFKVNDYELDDIPIKIVDGFEVEDDGFVDIYGKDDAA